MIQNLTIFILYFLFSGSMNALYSEKIEPENKYPQIREMLDKKNIDEAQNEIDLLSKKDNNDPTLLLYQTEIWIEKGEKNYQQRNFRKSFEFFKKAHNNWSIHPLVKKRYAELRSRNFQTENFPNTEKSEKKESIKSQEKSVSKKTIRVIEIEDNSDEIIAILSDIQKEIKSIKENNKNSVTEGYLIISTNLFWFLTGVAVSALFYWAYTQFKMNYFKKNMK